MREKLLRDYCLALLGLLISWIYIPPLYAHSDGAPMACNGSGEGISIRYYPPSYQSCGLLGCHYQYPIGSGEGIFRLYVLERCKPGEIVDILVSFKKTDTEYHGFQITAQDRYFNRLVGTFINVGDDSKVDGGGHFTTHTKKGTKQRYWHIKWQAPPADFMVANPVRFYAMGVEADNDGTPMGDYIYASTRLIVVESEKMHELKVSEHMKTHAHKAGTSYRRFHKHDTDDHHEHEGSHKHEVIKHEEIHTQHKDTHSHGTDAGHEESHHH